MSKTMKELVVEKLTEQFDGAEQIWIEILDMEVTLDEILAMPDETILDVLLDTCTSY